MKKNEISQGQKHRFKNSYNLGIHLCRTIVMEHISTTVYRRGFVLGIRLGTGTFSGWDFFGAGSLSPLLLLLVVSRRQLFLKITWRLVLLGLPWAHPRLSQGGLGGLSVLLVGHRMILEEGMAMRGPSHLGVRVTDMQHVRQLPSCVNLIPATTIITTMWRKLRRLQEGESGRRFESGWYPACASWRRSYPPYAPDTCTCGS